MLSISKSRLSQYSSLKQKKYRDQLSLYSISGLNAVETAIQSDNMQIEAYLVRQDQTNQMITFNDKISRSEQIPVFELSDREFRQFSDERNPQGIAIITRKPNTKFNLTSFRKKSFIYLDRVNDPGNLGTIIRTAAWFGITQILLSTNSADPFQPKTTRASVGLISHVQIYENIELLSLETLKQDKNYKLIGASAQGQQSLEGYKFDPSQSYGLIFGSEAHGISDQIIQILDEEVSIPVYGMGESLNLAASIAIFLYSYQHQIKLELIKK